MYLPPAAALPACRCAAPPARRVGDTNFRTSAAELDAALSALAASAPAWASTPYARRAALARQVAALSVTVAEALTADAVAHKGAYETGDGEEMAAWAATPAVFNDLARSLDALHAGAPRAPTSVRWRRADAASQQQQQQAVATVFPESLFEHLLFHGYAGELWLQPGADPCAVGGAAVLGGPGEVCLVLGAGNQVVVAVADVALKCLVHGAACVLKMNPVNEWAGPHLEACMRPLIAAGALRIVYGGPEVGRTLTAHPAVQTVRQHVGVCAHVTCARMLRFRSRCVLRAPPARSRCTSRAATRRTMPSCGAARPRRPARRRRTTST